MNSNINRSTTNIEDNIKTKNCKIKLNNRFKKYGEAKADRHSSFFSVISLDETKKALRSGIAKISQTLRELRITIGVFTQSLRRPIQRQHVLYESPATPGFSTPQTRAILGRTPTKLYSPFDIEGPDGKMSTIKHL